MADRTRVRGPRMAKHWHFIPGSSIGFTASSIFISGSLALDGPWTVLRMLGEYIITPTSAPAAGDNVTLAFGIGVVSSDAVGAGSASMPDPIAEPDYPWLYWSEHDFSFATTSADPAGEGGSLRQPFDIKSMRKLKPRESLVFVVEYANVVGNPPLTASISATRVLVAT